ncbi:autophagy-related protein 11 [Magnolia sinica]|uniref:autophagy-related protein 11 n=1 Tax=Magnolia sinica TaxID=86752 RepID=UPI00265922A3|nr:autophagy-related protein 11 [Magnolia sinica]
MSSIVTEDFVPGRKLVVHVAENGRTFELDCDESAPVEAVQRFIESVSGIRFCDQLLLCLDMKLEPQQPLSAYKLPRDDREVFLYNRARLHQDSPPPPREQFDIPEIPDPPSPSSSQNPHALDDASDPALKALPSYERQFRYHFQRGHVIYVRTQRKFEACEQLLKEQRVQERALDTARGSMDHYYQIVHQMYSDFMKCYSQQHRYHSDLLVNLGRDIERLRSCKLHPTLQTETRRCLLDLLKEENLPKWAEVCAGSHRQFETKITTQLKPAFTELKRRVEDLFSCTASTSIRDVETMIKDHHRYLNEQKSIMQSLSKDVNTVKKLVDDCVNCQLTASLRPHDAVSALGPMYDVHDKNHIPKMQVCDRAITKLLEMSKIKKNEMNLFVHNCMQKVAYIQYIIKDIRSQFPVYKLAMERQDGQFQHLQVVRGIGPAYRACLAEVVRRKASMKLYMGLAGQLADRLAAKREVEVRRREDFLKAQGIYIPRDILASMGLFDSPSHCDVKVDPFDTELLEVDIVDLDRYAPEYLLGMASKAERHAMSKGSISGDSCHLAESGEKSLEKSESEELLDCCESVEIAGTSKLEVENARLKAELASALAQICSFGLEFEYMSLDDSKLDTLLKNNAEKTAEALHLKDEYGKHLQSMLKMKNMQCLSYEKRIQELEQRLSDQYQKFLGGKDASESCKSEVSGNEEVNMPYVSTEPMEEVSCTSASLDAKLAQFSGQPGKAREGVDENMADFLGMSNQQAVSSARNSMDSSMREQHQDELQVGEKCGKETAESMVEPPNITLPCGTAEELDSASKPQDDLLLELQNALDEKSNQCSETESKLKATLEEVAVLRRDLEVSRKLLDESQMNCAHLENCLHEAREEAHTNLCAADRRASEYSALRASAVKMRGLFERLRSCINASPGPAGFADSLHSLALSLASPLNDNEDDGTVEFRACVKVLAERVGLLSQQRARLIKELEEKKELVQSLYTKHQLEKQANKEKISFGHLEVHELAAFILNSAGHYEAINRNCSNYYLSAESVALFTEHSPSRPSYIIGQIVHIERRTVRAPAPIRSNQGDQVNLLSASNVGGSRLGPVPGPTSNPYDLPIGCEYFVVTVAMLPDTIHSPAS